MDIKLLPVIQFSEKIISKGKGSWIYDEDGAKYLDLNAGQFCSILGHSNSSLKKEILKNLDEIQHTNSGMLSSKIIEAAERLNFISGEMNARSIFLTTGSEAVEFAMRYAKNIKNRNGVICFNKGYHGLTLGSQSVTYGGQYAYPKVENIFSIEVPTKDNYLEKIKEIEKILIENSNIAMILLEPIVSVGGMLLPPREYFIKLKNLSEKYEVFLVFDESQTGMGRTGTWFYYQSLECTPDILILSKGIGGGFPVSAVLFNEKVIPKDGLKLTHYSSHQNDPFLGAIVIEIINYISENNLLEEISKKGKYFYKRLKKLSEEYDIITAPRGKGLMLGFDLKIRDIDNYREVSKKFLKRIEEQGVILQATNGGQTIRILPNYLITYEEIDICIKALDYVLDNFYKLVF